MNCKKQREDANVFELFLTNLIPNKVKNWISIIIEKQ